MGGAGILVNSGNNLYLYGSGRVNANGGKGGANTWRDFGDFNFYKDNQYFWQNGGQSGIAGGGAGAGIGTNGASEVYPPERTMRSGTYYKHEQFNGLDAANGSNGRAANSVGYIFKSSETTINATGGAAGNTVDNGSYTFNPNKSHGNE